MALDEGDTAEDDVGGGDAVACEVHIALDDADKQGGPPKPTKRPTQRTQPVRVARPSRA